MKVRNFLAAYGAVQAAIGIVGAYVLLNPRTGRPWANAHPYVRGGDGTREGADAGFAGPEGLL
jgi:hypothetical protein